MSDRPILDLAGLQRALGGHAAAFRCVTDLQPAGQPGDKVFPPTYEGGKYATERRRVPDEAEPVETVLLDSVQSQANRMELALLEAWRRGRISLPVLTVDFSGRDLAKALKITSLEAPHRIADALLRDSLLDGVEFRRSGPGRRLDEVDNRHATALFELCPTALVFGLWDSTGPKGGLGAKFARALVSEIVGLHATVGVRTSSRLDPAQILLQAGPLYKAKDGGWTLDAAAGGKKLGKDGKPSEANHGNVLPSIADGGVTISKAVQTTVLSLPALRRLSFPLDEQAADHAAQARVDDAARVALAALALCAATLAREEGCDLRSRCQLFPMAAFCWQLLDEPGQKPKEFALDGDAAIRLFAEAVEAARAAGLPWQAEELTLRPSPGLVELVRRSQALAAQSAGAEAGN